MLSSVLFIAIGIALGTYAIAFALGLLLTYSRLTKAVEQYETRLRQNGAP